MDHREGDFSTELSNMLKVSVIMTVLVIFLVFLISWYFPLRFKPQKLYFLKGDFSKSLRKICQSMDFLWSIFSRIRMKSKILSISGKNMSGKTRILAILRSECYKHFYLFFFLFHWWRLRNYLEWKIWEKFYRSSRLKVFSRKGALKICIKFTGEHPCQSAFIEIALRDGCSPENLLHIFRNFFPENTSGWLLLILWNEVIVSYIFEGS